MSAKFQNFTKIPKIPKFAYFGTKNVGIDAEFRGDSGSSVQNSRKFQNVDFFGHDSLSVLQSNDGEELLCRSAGAPDYRIGDQVDIQHSGATSVSFPKT